MLAFVHRTAASSMLLAAGCGDEIVGYFDGSAGSSGSASSADSTAADTDPPVFEGPGCFSDDFEDGVIDPVLWNTWVEADSAIEESAGMLKFTPPTTGISDTGVINAYQSQFRFETGWVRVRVPIPPSPTRSVVFFLQILDEPDSLVSIQISQSTVSVGARMGAVEQPGDSFPADPYPAWIGIRADGPVVHFEVSSDGVDFTDLAVRDKPVPFESASALLMAQTYGQDLEGGIVAVDDFEVCLQ
ncbi:MAG TPA: hypothetical protein VFG69_17225 [Nannocystaceae bacterium]|nr:hypothetical protein [Nannocystaceae bacterium]